MNNNYNVSYTKCNCMNNNYNVKMIKIRALYLINSNSKKFHCQKVGPWKIITRQANTSIYYTIEI